VTTLPPREREADPALAWSSKMTVRTGGTGTVAHAGVVLPRLLADRVGLTRRLAGVMARAGFVPLRHRGRVLVDMVCALVVGARCLTDVEAMTRQVEIFGVDGGASDSTLLRVLGEFAGRLGADGLPGRRLAAATAGCRAAAWRAIVARHGTLPAVRVAGRGLTRPADVPGGMDRPVLVIRLDATIVEAASGKTGATGHFKGGFGFHPLTAWCSNVGDNLAVMLRPGKAGSFTASDHIAVLDAAIGQVPGEWRSDMLVTVDGAGASHALIDHLTSLNTHRVHGGRGRRVEYSVGWPVDERTRSALAKLRESDWSPALHADGTVDPDAGVADLTGLLRGSADGDRLAGWPADMRVIARRTPRPAGDQPELPEDPMWRYGAFATNTRAGQAQWLDARHRTQAHVEDKIKELKAFGARNLPSKDWDRNAAWLQLAALAATLTGWLRHLALDGDLARAEPKTMRYRLLAAPGRLVTHARRRTLKIPPGWAWSTDLADAWTRLRALHPA
jgi:hypothetical protein